VVLCKQHAFVEVHSIINRLFLRAHRLSVIVLRDFACYSERRHVQGTFHAVSP
jgi:hypothetical protein